MSETTKTESSPAPAAPTEPPVNEGGAASPATTESQAQELASEADHHDGHGSAHDDGGHSKAGIGSKLKGAVGNIGGVVKSLVGAIKNAPKAIVTSPVEFAKLLINGDTNTRILVFGFLVSVVLVVVSGGKIMKKLAPVGSHGKKVVHVDDHANEIADHEKELSIVSSNLLFLESFSVVISSKDDIAQKLDFEVYIEAETAEVAKAIKAHVNEAREVIVGSVQSEKYEDLSEEKGRAEFRGKIKLALEAALEKKWKVHGKIKRVLVTSFVMQ